VLWIRSGPFWSDPDTEFSFQTGSGSAVFSYNSYLETISNHKLVHGTNICGGAYLKNRCFYILAAFLFCRDKMLWPTLLDIRTQVPVVDMVPVTIHSVPVSTLPMYVDCLTLGSISSADQSFLLELPVSV